jgi:hypothetical protein
MIRGRELPDSYFNPKQLAMGTRHEMEHTNGRNTPENRLLAKNNAKDHLVEDPRYYTHLNAMERQVKSGKIR